MIVCVHHVCVLFCILSSLPVWSLLSSYFCRWTTSKIIGISPCWLLFTEVQHIWTINDLAPDIVLKPNVNSFRSMLFTGMWGTRLHRMSANVFSKSSSLLVCVCYVLSLCRRKPEAYRLHERLLEPCDDYCFFIMKTITDSVPRWDILNNFNNCRFSTITFSVDCVIITFFISICRFLIAADQGYLCYWAS